MTEQPAEKIVLEDRIKLLKVVVDKRQYKPQSTDIQWKKWTKRLTILQSSKFPTNAYLEHFPKDTRAQTSTLPGGIVESLDDNIIGIKFIPRSRKRNALEVMFEYHSLLMSFESESTMRKWAEELRRIANHYPMLLTTTINDTMKQGDYILVPDPEKLQVYDALLGMLAWSWDLTHIQGFQYRRMTSEVEITVGSESSTGEGFCVFYGRRLERFCDSLTEYARNLALKPLGKYSGSKSSTSLSTAASHSTQPTLGQDNKLLPPKDVSIDKRLSYNDTLPSVGYEHDLTVVEDAAKIKTSKPGFGDRNALLNDVD